MNSKNMNVVGIIAEYNPFHFGHKYHLNMAKKISNSQYSIAIISGSFVQRGEPSMVDKWTKAKMAIDNGVDLVIELPFIFATQSAELFAYGAVSLLDKLNIVDFLAFGSEINQINALHPIAKILAEEPPLYKENLKKHLNLGFSYPVACTRALQKFFDKYKHEKVNDYIIEKALSSPNTILSVEYLKSLIKLNSKIKPISIERIGSQYNEVKLNHKIASATAIREKILKNNNLNDIKDHMPYETYINLLKYLDKYKGFNSLYNYNHIIHYLLRIENNKKISNIINVETGLDNRIIDKSNQYNNMDSFIQSISSKRYTKSRIKRILVHLMMWLDKNTFNQLHAHHPSYVRILASNQKGFEIINMIKKRSKIPIIVKYSDYDKYKDPYLDKIIGFDKKATDLYFLGLKAEKPFNNMDFYISPYIKNSK